MEDDPLPQVTLMEWLSCLAKDDVPDNLKLSADTLRMCLRDERDHARRFLANQPPDPLAVAERAVVEAADHLETVRTRPSQTFDMRDFWDAVNKITDAVMELRRLRTARVS